MKISKMVLSELEYVRQNANLTEDEAKVFEYLAQGKSIVQISDLMCISTATVSRRIHDIKFKINKL